MMKKECYNVKVDVTVTGYLYVEAESEEEAERIAKQHDFSGKELSKMALVDVEVTDVA